MLEAWTKSSSFKVKDIVDAFGNVPWQLMQSAFTMLRPTLPLSKAVHVVDKAIKADPVNANKWDEFSEGFRALETWGNDNVDFPGACYVRYIEELYRNDALIKGTFTLSGKAVRLEKITVPLMCIVFEHDNIVPWQNAAALIDAIGSADKQLLKLPGGHVGAVVSRSAQKSLWPKMSAFWASRDTEGAKPGVTLNGHTNGHARVDVPVLVPEIPAPAPARTKAPPPSTKASKSKPSARTRSGSR